MLMAGWADRKKKGKEEGRGHNYVLDRAVISSPLLSPLPSSSPNNWNYRITDYHVSQRERFENDNRDGVSLQYLVLGEDFMSFFTDKVLAIREKANQAIPKTGSSPDVLTVGTYRSYKVAVIKPLLKKPSLDPDVLANYRPISNVPFISKVLEKVVVTQLLEHLQRNSLFEMFQSGLRAHHSTETALLKVTNDLLIASDHGLVSMMVLLDLSAAFDTVDHSILLHRLGHVIGIKGAALDWLRSYLSDRYQFAHVHGVPSSYRNIIRQYGIHVHCYADDTQLYLSMKPEEREKLVKLQTCLKDIKSWMSSNFLLLNSGKTEVFRGLAPSYLEELVISYQPNRPLRSQNAGLLVVPRVSRSRMGGRAFSYQAPLLWNQLPVQTIKFPSLVDIPNIAAGFERLSGSPALQNVVGSIDGPIALVTPYREPVMNMMVARFNRHHAKARSVIERAFGIMKTRWRAIFLKPLEVKPAFATKLQDPIVLLPLVWCWPSSVRDYLSGVSRTESREPDSENEGLSSQAEAMRHGGQILLVVSEGPTNRE
ncbi:putative RNA-directed DNA polymerase from transposon X-element [Takifugu flavidus]|uniref:Putative RNA-directed DNA polymerase from transposon X-element n=1 Tax=Takifugu flavidus TaxID=433684 RepID=A0A5C6MLD8_9TELE|nr:putative RNA-directed DNA polymerase from transposon X-element [Takifugu flavidus]